MLMEDGRMEKSYKVEHIGEISGDSLAHFKEELPDSTTNKPNIIVKNMPPQQSIFTNFNGGTYMQNFPAYDLVNGQREYATEPTVDELRSCSKENESKESSHCKYTKDNVDDMHEALIQKLSLNDNSAIHKDAFENNEYISIMPSNVTECSHKCSVTLKSTAEMCTHKCSDTLKTTPEIQYVSYESEIQMADIIRLLQKDLSEPYSIYTYRYFIHNWPHLCFLALNEGKTVGAIVCKLDLHRKVIRRGYIAMLAVDENYRKLKIGSNLVLKAIRVMVGEGADEVVLETEITNQPALQLYKNLGFVRDKRLFRYYLNGVDALRLKLWLR